MKNRTATCVEQKPNGNQKNVEIPYL
jgi:hypothetical protein